MQNYPSSQFLEVVSESLDDIIRQDLVTVILVICPDHLCTIQASVVCIHEPGRSVGIPVMYIAINKPIQKRERENSTYLMI